MNNRRLLILLGLHLLLSVGCAVLIPLWQRHEPDYYNVIGFLVTEHRLPTESEYPNGDAYTRQATLPPIYFLMGVSVVALMDNAEPVVYGLNPKLWASGRSRVAQPTRCSRTFRVTCTTSAITRSGWICASCCSRSRVSSLGGAHSKAQISLIVPKIRLYSAKILSGENGLFRSSLLVASGCLHAPEPSGKPSRKQ